MNSNNSTPWIGRAPWILGSIFILLIASFVVVGCVLVPDATGSGPERLELQFYGLLFTAVGLSATVVMGAVRTKVLDSGVTEAKITNAMELESQLTDAYAQLTSRLFAARIAFLRIRDDRPEHVRQSVLVVETLASIAQRERSEPFRASASKALDVLADSSVGMKDRDDEMKRLQGWARSRFKK